MSFLDELLNKNKTVPQEHLNCLMQMEKDFNNNDLEIELVENGKEYVMVCGQSQLGVTPEIPPADKIFGIEGFISITSFAKAIVELLERQFEDECKRCGLPCKLNIVGDRRQGLVEDFVCLLSKRVHIENMCLEDSIAIQTRQIHHCFKAIEKEYKELNDLVDNLSSLDTLLGFLIADGKMYFIAHEKILEFPYKIPEVNNGKLVKFNTITSCASALFSVFEKDINKRLEDAKMDKRVEIPQDKRSITIAIIVATLCRGLNIKPVSELDAGLLKAGDEILAKIGIE